MTTSHARTPKNMQEIEAWAATAITEAEAEKRGLVLITTKKRWRNWSRKADLKRLFAIYQTEQQASPVLVEFEDGRAGLFVEKRTVSAPVRQIAFQMIVRKGVVIR